MEEGKILKKVAKFWGRQVIHIIDVVRGKLSWNYRMLWDVRRRYKKITGIICSAL